MPYIEARVKGGKPLFPHVEIGFSREILWRVSREGNKGVKQQTAG